MMTNAIYPLSIWKNSKLLKLKVINNKAVKNTNSNIPFFKY